MFIAFTNLMTNYTAATLSFALLSACDLMLTKISIDLGIAVEANPLMSALFSFNFIAALTFKSLIVTMVIHISHNLWSRVEVRTILAAGNLLMTTIVVYEVAGILGTVLG